MKKNVGFTLIELMVAVAILGILAATAIPLYNTWRQRTYGAEATVMLKSITEAEIMHILKKETFFPKFGDPEIRIWNDGTEPPSLTDIQRVKDNLNIPIPIGHLLDFHIISVSDTECWVTISSAGNRFALFGDGHKNIMGVVHSTGEIDISTFGN